MKITKKILSLVLTATICLSLLLSACTNGSSSPSPTVPDATTTPDGTESPSNTPDTTTPDATQGNTPDATDIPGAPASDFEYEMTADGIVIIKYIGNAIEVRIPEKIDGKPVVKIENSTLQNCSSLKSITIPKSVAIMGKGVFNNCPSLERVVLSYHNGTFEVFAHDDVKYSDPLRAVFDGCDSIKSVVMTIASDDGKIVEEAFYGFDKLTDAIIVNGITSIGNQAFRGCTSLKSIIIPDSVTEIGEAAFLRSGIKNITIPASVTNLGDNPFFGCASLEEITLNGALPAHFQSFEGCSSLASVTIGDAVTAIPDSLFNSLKALKTVQLGKNITSIGNSAFEFCSALESINIPDSVETIGYGAFWGCDSLKSINIPKNMTQIGNGAFMGCGITSITIPDWVTSIGKEAFRQCGSLKSLNIPDSVTSIFYDDIYDAPFIGIPEIKVTYKGKTYEAIQDVQGGWYMQPELYSAINNG